MAPGLPKGLPIYNHQQRWTQPSWDTPKEPSPALSQSWVSTRGEVGGGVGWLVGTPVIPHSLTNLLCPWGRHFLFLGLSFSTWKTDCKYSIRHPHQLSVTQSLHWPEDTTYFSDFPAQHPLIQITKSGDSTRCPCPLMLLMHHFDPGPAWSFLRENLL